MSVPVVPVGIVGIDRTKCLSPCLVLLGPAGLNTVRIGAKPYPAEPVAIPIPSSVSSPAQRHMRPYRLNTVAWLFWISAWALVASLGCSHDPKADLVIINGPEPETLDPHILSGIAEQRIAPSLFAGLMRRNPTNALPMPGLAERHEVSPDGLRYLFHLRPSLKWSTGEPLTARDVVYSWRRLVEPATAARYATLLSCVAGADARMQGQTNNLPPFGVRAVNDTILEVELTQPTPYFLELCALPALAIVPRTTIERLGDQWIRATPLPTSGPYMLEQWRVNDRIRLQRNPLYWDASNVRNSRVDLLPSESSSATINLFETDQVDIVWDRNLFPPELTPELGPPRYHSFSYLGTYFMRFNTTRAPFQDTRIRRAIALAIDRDRLVHRITRGGERAARSFTPPGCGGYTPPDLVGFNLSEARQLLKEAGFEGGRGMRPIEYLVNSGGGGGGRLHEQIAVELQAQLLENLGIRMEIRPVETKIYYSEQSRLNYDVCRSSWLGDFNDPATFLEVFRSRNGNNRTGWNNPAYDQFLDAAASSPTKDQRFDRLRQAESLLTNLDPPIVPLYFYSGFCAFDPTRVDGIHTASNLMDLHPLWAIARKPKRVVPE